MLKELEGDDTPSTYAKMRAAIILKGFGQKLADFYSGDNLEIDDLPEESLRIMHELFLLAYNDQKKEFNATDFKLSLKDHYEEWESNFYVISDADMSIPAIALIGAGIKATLGDLSQQFFHRDPNQMQEIFIGEED